MRKYPKIKVPFLFARQMLFSFASAFWLQMDFIDWKALSKFDLERFEAPSTKQ